jgi:CBS domain containing-hemolysin-like protein
MDWNAVLLLFVAAVLVVANGFFVAAEFALVKIRPVRIEQMVIDRRPFARIAQGISNRLEAALSACQLGITMASLALGWVGEPAFAKLLHPVFELLKIESAALVHGISFAIAFTFITAIHLVIGEQAPKIYAIRQPERMLLWCALPLRIFMMLSYPLMVTLNWTTSLLLGWIGLKDQGHHEVPHSEDEIRALISEAHLHGDLTRSEHHLINAVFEFDDMVCRRVMLPRSEVDFFDIHDSIQESISMARRTKHTRYPVCDGSLDEVLGVIHVKDLVGLEIDNTFEWTTIMRPPKKVPENMPISKLLRHFQATHQLMAFVIDEYGTVIGIVTLENVLEQIIGAVADEFDTEQPDIVPEGPDQWVIKGSVGIEELERLLGITFGDVDVDTFSGLLTDLNDRLPAAGDSVDLGPYTAEVLDVRDNRAIEIRVSRKVSKAP